MATNGREKSFNTNKDFNISKDFNTNKYFIISKNLTLGQSRPELRIKSTGIRIWFRKTDE